MGDIHDLRNSHLVSLLNKDTGWLFPRPWISPIFLSGEYYAL